MAPFGSGAITVPNTTILRAMRTLPAGLTKRQTSKEQLSMLTNMHKPRANDTHSANHTFCGFIHGLFIVGMTL